MTILGDLAQGRDNNLNLIRMLAALAVLFSHAVPIALGPLPPEPLETLVGHSLGTLSVMVFFAVSGFLIPLSFERTPSRLRFVNARALRIMPGLLVNLLFVAFILGPIVTQLPVQTYLADPAVYIFVLRDLAMVPLVYVLPGVFEGQPVEEVVGSIWTLRHEVACYAGVFILGIAGLFRYPAAFRLLSLSYLVVIWPAIAWADPPMHPLVSGFFRLSLPFAVGTIFYAWRDRLPLTLPGVVGSTALAWAFHDTPLGYPALCLALGYATFWAGYLPGGVIRAYNRLGDYSYGVYVYAFPIQGWAVWAFGSQSPLENSLYSLPPTLFLSVLSWHLIEKPALGLLKKNRIAARAAENTPERATE